MKIRYILHGAHPPPPFSMAKIFSVPQPLFLEVKLHLPPALPLCSPPPPPPLSVISDQSLRAGRKCKTFKFELNLAGNTFENLAIFWYH